MRATSEVFVGTGEERVSLVHALLCRFYALAAQVAAITGANLPSHGIGRRFESAIAH
ncbi:MAG: hypothetical protein QGG29_08090 [Prochlorococcaceae cyanobacterium ETNP18_MAG_17]|nr:hypothetical protein [Prochlorococcaceae cyanobacterium ETNP18_MAG_17]